MVSEKKRFDEADKIILRCLMRRFGWERRQEADRCCLWAETFEGCLLRDYKAFAWYLLEEILHPWGSAELQRRHSPTSVRASRHSHSGVSGEVLQLHTDLLQWQEQHGLASLPQHGQDAMLARRVEKYIRDRKARQVKVLEQSYPYEFVSRDSFLSYKAESAEELCPHVDSVPDRGEQRPWRSDTERELMQSIPGWREEVLQKESFVPTLDMLSSDANPIAAQVLSLLGNPSVSFDSKLPAVAEQLGCAADWLQVSERLSNLLLHRCIDDSETLARFYCRLCATSCSSYQKFLSHLAEKHAQHLSKERAMVEYRKKVLGMSGFAGPNVSCLVGSWHVFVFAVAVVYSQRDWTI